MLHGSCFHEDPWDLSTIAGVMGIGGFFGRIAWENEQASGFVLALDLGEECEIVSLAFYPSGSDKGADLRLWLRYAARRYGVAQDRSFSRSRQTISQRAHSMLPEDSPR